MPVTSATLAIVCSLPSVMVIETNDIVFPEVIAALHFDHHAIDFAGVGEAVGRAGGNVGRLVRTDRDFVLAVHHLGNARDHHPVLAATLMILQRKRSAGLDHDTLDLEARPVLQHGVSAPGAMHGAVQPRARVAACLEAVDDALYILCAAAPH